MTGSLCFAFLAFASLRLSPGQSLTYPIVDTGVTDFFSDSAVISKPQPGGAFYGQDANYDGNQPSYKYNGDGTISDLVTGLMWAQTMQNMTYAQAVTNVKSVRLGGFSDWRIPTIKELYSLIMFYGNVNGISAGTKMFIDTNYFTQPTGYPRQIDAQTLSGTQYTGIVMNNQQCMFGVNFIDGRIKCYPKSNAFYFRYVRGVSNYGANSFVSNGDNTISDRATGLMWAKNDSGKGMNWQAALSYCEDLTFAGYSDWRLPNVKELQGIVDYTKGPQTTKTPAIDSLFQVTQIREPDGTMDYPYFWSSTTHQDGPKPAQNGAYVCFGQCWGKLGGSSKLTDVHGAGAQRSDPKSVGSQTYPQYMGPQGDMRTVLNYVRCVRNI